MRVKWNRHLDGSQTRRGDEPSEQAKQLPNGETSKHNSPKFFRIFKRKKRHRLPDDPKKSAADQELSVPTPAPSEADDDDCASISSVATCSSQPVTDVCQRDRALSLFSSFRISFPKGKKKSRKIAPAIADALSGCHQKARYSSPDLRKPSTEKLEVHDVPSVGNGRGTGEFLSLAELRAENSESLGKLKSSEPEPKLCKSVSFSDCQTSENTLPSSRSFSSKIPSGDSVVQVSNGKTTEKPKALLNKLPSRSGVENLPADYLNSTPLPQSVNPPKFLPNAHQNADVCCKVDTVVDPESLTSDNVDGSKYRTVSCASAPYFEDEPKVNRHPRESNVRGCNVNTNSVPNCDYPCLTSNCNLNEQKYATRVKLKTSPEAQFAAFTTVPQWDVFQREECVQVLISENDSSDDDSVHIPDGLNQHNTCREVNGFSVPSSTAKVNGSASVPIKTEPDGVRNIHTNDGSLNYDISAPKCHDDYESVETLPFTQPTISVNGNAISKEKQIEENVSEDSSAAYFPSHCVSENDSKIQTHPNEQSTVLIPQVIVTGDVADTPNNSEIVLNNTFVFDLSHNQLNSEDKQNTCDNYDKFSSSFIPVLPTPVDENKSEHSNFNKYVPQRHFVDGDDFSYSDSTTQNLSKEVERFTNPPAVIPENRDTPIVPNTAENITDSFSENNILNEGVSYANNDKVNGFVASSPFSDISKNSDDSNNKVDVPDSSLSLCLKLNDTDSKIFDSDSKNQYRIIASKETGMPVLTNLNDDQLEMPGNRSEICKISCQESDGSLNFNSLNSVNEFVPCVKTKVEDEYIRYLQELDPCDAVDKNHLIPTELLPCAERRQKTIFDTKIVMLDRGFLNNDRLNVESYLEKLAMCDENISLQPKNDQFFNGLSKISSNDHASPWNADGSYYNAKSGFGFPFMKYDYADSTSTFPKDEFIHSTNEQQCSTLREKNRCQERCPEVPSSSRPPGLPTSVTHCDLLREDVDTPQYPPSIVQTDKKGGRIYTSDALGVVSTAAVGQRGDDGISPMLSNIGMTVTTFSGIFCPETCGYHDPKESTFQGEITEDLCERAIYDTCDYAGLECTSGENYLNSQGRQETCAIRGFDLENVNATRLPLANGYSSNPSNGSEGLDTYKDYAKHVEPESLVRDMSVCEISPGIVNNVTIPVDKTNGVNISSSAIKDNYSFGICNGERNPKEISADGIVPPKVKGLSRKLNVEGSKISMIPCRRNSHTANRERAKDSLLPNDRTKKGSKLHDEDNVISSDKNLSPRINKPKTKQQKCDYVSSSKCLDISSAIPTVEPNFRCGGSEIVPDLAMGNVLFSHIMSPDLDAVDDIEFPTQITNENCEDDPALSVQNSLEDPSAIVGHTSTLVPFDAVSSCEYSSTTSNPPVDVQDLEQRGLRARCASLPAFVGQVHLTTSLNETTNGVTRSKIAIYGKSRIPKKQTGPRGGLHVATKPSRPPMWLSKAELTQEIQRLGNLCEARTKELNRLKMETKHVTVGFDAFAALFKYMVEDLNALSVPKLSADLEKTLKQLELTKQDLAYYEREVEEMKAHHCQELNDLSNKLFEVYQGEVAELNAKHNEEINHLKSNQQKQIESLSTTFNISTDELKAQHEKLVARLEQEIICQQEEMKIFQEREIKDLEEKHAQSTKLLQEHIEQLQKKCAELKQHSLSMEDAMRKDTDSKLQWVTTRKVDLEKEVESLKAVLEMKNKELHSLRVQNLEMEKQLEELPLAREKIKMLQARAEDLEALMIEKTKLERKLSSENQQIRDTYEKESKVNKRLSMENEELQWRLRQAEQSLISGSFSEAAEYQEITENGALSPVKSPAPQTLSRSVFFTFMDKDDISSYSPRSQYKKITSNFSANYKTSPGRTPKSPTTSPRRPKSHSEPPQPQLSSSTPRKIAKQPSVKHKTSQKRQRAGGDGVSTNNEQNEVNISSMAESMASSVSSESSVFEHKERLLEEHKDHIMASLEILREQRSAEIAMSEPVTPTSTECMEVKGSPGFETQDMSRSAEFADPKTYYHMTFPVLKEGGIADCDTEDSGKVSNNSSSPSRDATDMHSMSVGNSPSKAGKTTSLKMNLKVMSTSSPEFGATDNSTEIQECISGAISADDVQMMESDKLSKAQGGWRTL